MASRPIHIKNYTEAQASGIIPGGFKTNETGLAEYVFPEVESVNTRGARLVWGIRVAAFKEGAQVSLLSDWLNSERTPPEGVAGVLTTHSYQVSPNGVKGKERAGGKPTYVRSGKNIGKVNETNPITQALRDALSLYNAKLKRAALTLPAKRPGPVGVQPPPMLVKQVGETRKATLTPDAFKEGITVQRKLNGVRLVAYLTGGPGRETVQLYSRTRSDYLGFTHIRSELLCNLLDPPTVPTALIQGHCTTNNGGNTNSGDLKRLQEVYANDVLHLDGEVYLHGKSLQWISGQARKENDEKSLDFMVFDCFFPAAKAAGHDMPSANRQKYLDLFFQAARQGGPECALVHVKRVENIPAKTIDELYSIRDKFLKEGYEGAIARKDCAGYEYSLNNYHSANLVKIKPIFDSEFDVVGYTQGSKGKDVGAVIWICEVDPEHAKDPSDKVFHVAPKDMSYEERYHVYKCLSLLVDNNPDAVRAGKPARLTRFERDFLGRPLTVEYPERSAKTGKPVQAKALTFRTYEGDISTDPLKRLYSECSE